MLYICPQCKAKYNILDSKIKDKTNLKVRCRRCNTVSVYNEQEQKKLQSKIQNRVKTVPPKQDLFKNWYYLKQKEKHGPFDFRKIDTYCQTEIITPTMYVWHPSFDGWKKARDVKILMPLFEKKKLKPEKNVTEPPPLPVLDKHDEEHDNKELHEGQKGVKISVHKTSNLIGLLEELEKNDVQVDSSSTVSEKSDKLEVSDIFGIDNKEDKKDKEERKKIVDLLNHIEEKENKQNEFADEEIEFFNKVNEEQEETEQENLKDFLKSLEDVEKEDDSEADAVSKDEEDDNIFPDEIPDIEIPDHAVVPSRKERQNLVQEFSLMIRLEKKTRKMKIVFLAILLLIGFGIYAGIKIINKRNKELQKQYAQKMKKQNNKNPLSLNRVKYKIDNIKSNAHINSDKQLTDAEKKLYELQKKEAKKRHSKQHVLIAKKQVKINDKKNNQLLKYANNADFNNNTFQKKSFFKKLNKKKSIKSNGKEEKFVSLNIGFGAKPISEADITKALKRKMKYFQGCKRYLIVNDQLIVTLKFTITQNGTVGNVHFKTDNKVPQEFYKCLNSSIKNWRFHKTDQAKIYIRQLIL